MRSIASSIIGSITGDTTIEIFIVNNRRKINGVIEKKENNIIRKIKNNIIKAARNYFFWEVIK